METTLFYTIQQVTHQTGISEHTLRFYERMGLLGDIERAPNGHRRYSEDDLSRIRFLTRMRMTGMPLKQLLAYVAGGPRERQALLEAHRAAVVEQIGELERSVEAIDYKISIYKKASQDNS